MPVPNFVIIAGSILAFILLIGLVMGRLYRRATREVSLVKTGAGGKKVIMDGGTIVVPLLHEISPVNMKTLRLEVARQITPQSKACPAPRKHWVTGRSLSISCVR